jgi:hypothetical protein
MEKTLMQFGADTGVNWSAQANADPNKLMYEVAYWMNVRKYPVPAVTQKSAHWVLITGLDADATPSTATSVISIETVYIIDPDIATDLGNPCSSPDIGGSSVTIPYSIWISDYWYAPVDVPPSGWTNQFVAVIEPPQKKGQAVSPKKQIESGVIIPPHTASSLANAWLSTADTSEKSRYWKLRSDQVQIPMLVNIRNKAYYIVPIGHQGTNISDGAVLINAYSGERQEIAVFSSPRRYLSAEDALLVALKAANAQINQVSKNGELIFQPSDQAQSRIFPLWKFIIHDSAYFVSQSKHVYKKLTQERAGN